MLKEREKPDQIHKREITDQLRAAESNAKHFKKQMDEFSKETLMYKTYFRNEESRNEGLERELKNTKNEFLERLEAFKIQQKDLDQSKAYINILEKENKENISCLMWERQRLEKEKNELASQIKLRDLKRLAKKRKREEEQ